MFHGLEVELGMESPKNAYGARGRHYYPSVQVKPGPLLCSVTIHSLKVVSTSSDSAPLLNLQSDTVWLFDEVVGAGDGEKWNLKIDDFIHAKDIAHGPLRLIAELTVEKKNGESFRGTVDAVVIPRKRIEYGLIGD